jgi:hypothetical protein
LSTTKVCPARVPAKFAPFAFVAVTVTTCPGPTVYFRVPELVVPLAPGVEGLLGAEATPEVPTPVPVTSTDPAPLKIQTSSLLVELRKLPAGTFAWNLSLNPPGALRQEDVPVALYSPKRNASPVTALEGNGAMKPRDRAAARPVMA